MCCGIKGNNKSKLYFIFLHLKPYFLNFIGNNTLFGYFFYTENILLKKSKLNMLKF